MFGKETKLSISLHYKRERERERERIVRSFEKSKSERKRERERRRRINLKFCVRVVLLCIDTNRKDCVCSQILVKHVHSNLVKYILVSS